MLPTLPTPRLFPALATRQRHDSLRGLSHGIRRREIEAALFEHLLPFLDVGAFHPDDDRHRHAQFLHGGDHAGGEPANFLDVGGGANAEQIRNAFKILMSDRKVRAVLINIFGGILRCDVLAQGVIAAVKDLSVAMPIVIRMEGTNVEEGKRMLQESGLNFTTADSMSEAATKVVQLAG